MKIKKETYVTPQMELIVVEIESYCVSASFGNGAGSDAVNTPEIKTKNSFFNSTNPFVKDEG